MLLLLRLLRCLLLRLLRCLLLRYVLLAAHMFHTSRVEFELAALECLVVLIVALANLVLSFLMVLRIST